MDLWAEHVAADDPVGLDSLRDVRLCITDPAEVYHVTCHPVHSHGRVLASADRASVFRGILRLDGFGGSWSPTNGSFGFLDIAGIQVDLIFTSLWDGGPDGRMGSIIASAPPRDRALLRDFFRELDIVECVISEVKRGWWGWASRPCDPDPPMSANPSILFFRLRDNIYIVFMNLTPALLPQARTSVMCLLNCLYGVP